MQPVVVHRVFIFLVVVLIGAFLAGVWKQRDIGLADNSDFLRSARTFTSGPVGFPTEYPEAGSEAYRKRFFYYWLPKWNVQWGLQRPNSSTDLLWLPGALAGALSGGTMDLRVVSLFPKLLLLGELLLIMAWAWRQTAHRLTLLLALGVPTVLMFTTTDYLAFLQSFYQEAGNLVFLLPVLFALVYFRRQPTWKRLAVLLTFISLLATTKRANAYWPLLMLPFVLAAWLARHREDARKPQGRISWMVGLVATVFFTLVCLRATHIGGVTINSYDSLFDGALTFSRHPGTHLERFGWPDAGPCIYQSGFSATGTRFLAAHAPEMTHRYALLTYLHEPHAIWSAASYVAGNMQDISLEYLGKHELGDSRADVFMLPASFSTETRFWWESARSGWNGWSALKFWCFPTGGALVLCLVGFAGWFGWGLLTPAGAARDLATVGLVVTLACPIDMGVAIVGDGRYELIKHLFFANLLFDIAAIVFLASVAVWIEARMTLARVDHPI